MRDRTFTLTAVLTLAICIAANVAVFSIVHSVVLRPLPFPESDRILIMYNSYPGVGAVRVGSAVPDYYDQKKGPGLYSGHSQDGRFTGGGM